ncbi:TM2 domain-containing protein [Actinoplanes sp. NPDC089786]|uniref:TM2 domain-containing protein n=1 Tax=Actinoplanes sp. NPDC089786 TaxID=3155185 RepID=UPI00341A757B
MQPVRFGQAEFEYDSVKKDARVAYALWFACGIFGGHRFYLATPAAPSPCCSPWAVSASGP